MTHYCVVFLVTSNNSNGRFASYLHTPAYWPATPGYSAPPPSGGNGPGRITLRRRRTPSTAVLVRRAPLALRLWSGPGYPRVPPY
jgi:hypothetical protein